MGEKALRKTIAVAAALLLIVAGAVFVLPRLEGAGGSEKQCESIRKAVSGRALQCYVIEGSYPESLDYLKDNYGLAVNTDDYRVIYIPVAENMPPEIKVTRREKD